MVEYDFVKAIESQLIFQRLFKNHSSRFGNKLEIGRNRDLIYAVENFVRCCTWNSQTKNYRLLACTSYQISDIGLNEDATYIYTTDSHRINVERVPLLTNAELGSVVTKESYELKDLGSDILKIVWNNFSHRGLSLTVLQDKNRIKLFDLTQSETPVVSLDLNLFDNFHNEIATSISYGSNTNLIGGLTLYITTESSKVFAIYPFLPEETSLSVSVDEVKEALDDSNDVLSYINNVVPTTSIRALVRKQLRWFSILHSQIAQLEPTSVKQDKYNNTQLCYTVKCKSPALLLQGPLIDLQMGKVKDIANIGHSPDVSLLAVINEDSTDLTVKWLCQLKPLVMSLNDSYFTELSENLSSLTITSPPVQKAIEAKPVNDRPYTQPKIGFGLVDDFDLEDEHTTPESEPESVNTTDLDDDKSTTKLVKKSFQSLDEISVDIISECNMSLDRKLIRTSDARFLVHSPDKTIVCSPKEWYFSLPDITDVKVFNSYSLVQHTGQYASSVLVKDDITFTGDYLLSAFDDKDKPADLVLIEEGEVLKKAKESKVVEDESSQGVVKIQSKLSAELIKGIESDLHNLRSINEINFKISDQDKDTEALSKINNFSINTFEQVRVREVLLMKLSLQVATNIMDLKHQISVYNSSDPISTAKYADRIKTLKTSQSAITERLTGVHAKLVKKIEDIKISRQFPLSDKEKNWHQEIEDISEQAKTGNLASSIEDLTNQVEHIKKTINIQKEPIGGFSREVFTIKNLILDQKKTMQKLKTDIDSLSTSLDIEAQVV